jgi:UDP-glucose 4-epimerase
MAGVDYVFHLAALECPESMDKPGEAVSDQRPGNPPCPGSGPRQQGEESCDLLVCRNLRNNPDVPKRETMLPEPRSPYAITKLDDEYYGRMFTEDFDRPWLRFVTSMSSVRGRTPSQYAAAVPIFIDRCLKGEELVIYGGRNRRVTSST